MANKMKVAVIHDWLTGMRGGEVVLESILQLYPQADLYTLLYNKGELSETIANRKIFTSFIDRLPFKTTRYRHYLPLFPAAIELFDLHGYDLVISSSHCVARGVIVPPGTPHLSFVHSPMRYVWDMYHHYFPPRGLINRMVIPFFASSLRTWDAAAAHRVDRYTCNSKFVASRIGRFYGKEATVIHPPCVTDGSIAGSPHGREDFYFIQSALVPYKRIDLAIEAFNRSGKKLIIGGDGPELSKLKQLAGSNIEFRGRIPRAEMELLFRTATALIFPGIEDFGIVPVEAQAQGCPVIAYGKGGALETVVENKTGLFFDEESPEAIEDAINRLARLKLKQSDFQKSINRFTDKKFKEGMQREISRLL